MSLDPVRYRGELVALAGPERFHIVAPWLQGRPFDDPEARFVAFMCRYRLEVESGAVPGPFDSERAAFWARCVLIDAAELDLRAHQTDEELARHFGVPTTEIVSARKDPR